MKNEFKCVYILFVIILFHITSCSEVKDTDNPNCQNLKVQQIINILENSHEDKYLKYYRLYDADRTFVEKIDSKIIKIHQIYKCYNEAVITPGAGDFVIAIKGDKAKMLTDSIENFNHVLKDEGFQCLTEEDVLCLMRESVFLLETQMCEFHIRIFFKENEFSDFINNEKEEKDYLNYMNMDGEYELDYDNMVFPPKVEKLSENNSYSLTFTMQHGRDLVVRNMIIHGSHVEIKDKLLHKGLFRYFAIHY